MFYSLFQLGDVKGLTVQYINKLTRGARDLRHQEAHVETFLNDISLMNRACLQAVTESRVYHQMEV